MSFCLWLTGLPGSGKSTILRELAAMLASSGISAVSLSLDNIRKVITPEPRYTEEERAIVYRSLALMAKLLVMEGGKNVIIDATANRREYRDLARVLIPEFAEIYIRCPIETCEKREARRLGQPVEHDLYRHALDGTLKGGLPGISAPYEEQEHPEVVVRSDLLSPRESAKRIMAHIESRWPRQTQEKEKTC